MLKYFKLVFTLAPKILHAFIWHIWGYARHPEKTPIEERYRVVRKLIIQVCNAFHCKFDVEGIEYIRELERNNQCYLLTPNHLSDLDPLAIVYFSEKPITFVAKKEIIEFPFIGTVVKALDGVFIDREDLKQNVMVMKRVRETIESGKASVMIFPEGTRNKNAEDNTLPFKPGSFKPAIKIKAPIVPLSLYGTQRPFQKDIDWKQYPIEFCYHKPLTPEQYKELKTPEICDYVYNEVSEKVYDYRENYDAQFLNEEKQKIPYEKGCNDKYFSK